MPEEDKTMTPTAKLLLKVIQTEGPFFAMGYSLAKHLGITSKTLKKARDILVSEGLINLYAGPSWGDHADASVNQHGYIYSDKTITELESTFYVKLGCYLFAEPTDIVHLTRECLEYEQYNSGAYSEEGTLDTGEVVEVVRYRTCDTTFKKVKRI